MTPNAIKIFIFGAGNVATHLLKVFLSHPDKIEITGAWNRHPEKLLHSFSGKIPVYTDLNSIPPADIYILALKDDVVGEFSKKIARLNGLKVHTSGVLPIDAINGKRKGYFYPLQSFHKAKDNYDWNEIPVFIHADNKKDLQLLEKLARIITPEVLKLDDEQKKVLHIAAVFANNFSNLMYIIADKIVSTENIDFKYLLPLIKETVKRLESHSPRDVQTGPARRKDEETMRKHLDWLKARNMNTEADIYRLLSQYITELYH